MKHTGKVTLILLAIFLLSQVIGLLITQSYIDVEASLESGVTEFKEMQISGVTIERPDVDESYSFIYIMIAILIGTGLVLLIIHFKKDLIWKLWYFIAVVLCLAIAFGAFMDSTIALVFGALLGAYKIFRPSIIVHNFTELFIYGGLAVIFVPILNLFSIVILLLLISLYDMYAVWKSKHMIKLAKFQTKAKMFAGLLVPYKMPGVSTRKRGKKVKKVKTQVAILGGGDIGFPLMFAGVILKTYGLAYALIIPPFATIALGLLFLHSKKGKFYPAMPFVTAGCFVGFGVVQLALQFL